MLDIIKLASKLTDREKMEKYLSPMAKAINRFLEEAGPPEVSVHPVILVRQPPPIEIDREKERAERAKKFDPLAYYNW